MSLSQRNIAIIIGVFFLIVVALCTWWFVFERPARLKDEAVASSARAAISNGDAKSAEDAIEQIGDLETRNELREELERSSKDAINSHPKAGLVIDDSLYSTALRELCNTASYRNDPECAAMRNANSK